MSLNLVTVTIAATASPVDATAVEGHFTFFPNGTEWPMTVGALPIVPEIQSGPLVLGTASVQLVASDNFAVGVLNWDVLINIRGLATINVAALPILFAGGASQSVWDILQANGWNPVGQP